MNSILLLKSHNWFKNEATKKMYSNGDEHHGNPSSGTNCQSSWPRNSALSVPFLEIEV